MLDIGWTELLVIGVVALIVIGPRDLPMALHTFGKYVGKLRGMARDFQHGIDEIARQHELREMQEGINKFRSPEEAIENYVQGLENQGSKPATVDHSTPDDAGTRLTGGETPAVQGAAAAPSENTAPADQPAAGGKAGEAGETAEADAPAGNVKPGQTATS